MSTNAKNETVQDMLWIPDSKVVRRRRKNGKFQSRLQRVHDASREETRQMLESVSDAFAKDWREINKR